MINPLARSHSDARVNGARNGNAATGIGVNIDTAHITLWQGDQDFPVA